MPAPLDSTERLHRQSIGRQVRRARMLNGWSLQDLAFHLARVTNRTWRRQMVDKIEEGQWRLSDELITQLEVSLELRPGAFCSSVAEPFSRLQVCQFTADRDVLPGIKMWARQSMIDAVENRLQSAQQAMRSQAFRSPFIFLRAAPCQDEIEQQAELLRKRWGLGAGPIADVTFALEANSVVVAQNASPRRMTIFSGRVRSTPIVFVDGLNSADPTSLAEYRLRALNALIKTLALSRNLPADDAKIRAEKIARAILLPRNAITDAFGTQRNRITAVNLVTLASRFLLPKKAALDRCVEAGVIDEAHALRLERAMRPELIDSREKPQWSNLLPPVIPRNVVQGQKPESEPAVPK